ncbi:MAG: hypothetical protein HS126_14570 [Anaerolineales bacterium]|nr:hypothetical protein [Anaerolineales bacterium]
MKKRIIAAIAGIALLLAVTGVSGVVADTLGYAVTSQVHACPSGSSSGGGC